MTTGSTNTVINHGTTAGFNAWVNELTTMLITTLGLTQTSDTGQLAFPISGVSIPATNTAAGYYILRFNDTLQSTSPVFIKLEVGTGGTASVPAIWVTIGTGSNGSGTLTGLGTRVACCYTVAPGSTVTNYVSRACYNTTQGVLWIDWKQGAPGSSISSFGFLICRSVDTTGAPTATAVGLQGASASGTLTANSGNPFQWIDYSNSTIYGPVNVSSGLTFTAWTFIPFGPTSPTALTTVFGTAGQVFPCFQYAPTASTPGMGVTNALAMAISNEISTGSTVTLSILGSTSLTYIGGLMPSQTIAGTSYAVAAISILRIWQ